MEASIKVVTANEHSATCSHQINVENIGIDVSMAEKNKPSNLYWNMHFTVQYIDEGVKNENFETKNQKYNPACLFE